MDRMSPSAEPSPRQGSSESLPVQANWLRPVEEQRPWVAVQQQESRNVNENLNPLDSPWSSLFQSMPDDEEAEAENPRARAPLIAIPAMLEREQEVQKRRRRAFLEHRAAMAQARERQRLRAAQHRESNETLNREMDAAVPDPDLRFHNPPPPYAEVWATPEPLPPIDDGAMLVYGEENIRREAAERGMRNDDMRNGEWGCRVRERELIDGEISEVEEGGSLRGIEDPITREWENWQSDQRRFRLPRVALIGFGFPMASIVKERDAEEDEDEEEEAVPGLSGEAEEEWGTAEEGSVEENSDEGSDDDGSDEEYLDEESGDEDTEYEEGENGDAEDGEEVPFEEPEPGNFLDAEDEISEMEVALQWLAADAALVPQWRWSNDKCCSWIFAVCATYYSMPLMEAREIAMSFDGFGPDIYLLSAPAWSRILGRNGEGLYTLIVGMQREEGAVPHAINLMPTPYSWYQEER